MCLTLLWGSGGTPRRPRSSLAVQTAARTLPPAMGSRQMVCAEAAAPNRSRRKREGAAAARNVPNVAKVAKVLDSATISPPLQRRIEIAGNGIPEVEEVDATVAQKFPGLREVGVLVLSGGQEGAAFIDQLMANLQRVGQGIFIVARQAVGRPDHEEY